MSQEQEAFGAYVDSIGRDAERLAEVARSGVTPEVPSCPGWTVADLVSHVTVVYRFWSTQLDARRNEPVEVEEAEVTEGADVIAGFEVAAGDLVERLGRADPEDVCWNWAGIDTNAAWVARRMALESAVHRVDGDQAIGRVLPVETALAVDGIDERIAVHLATDVPEAPEATLGGSLCLVCEDAPDSFVVEVSGGRLEWRHGRGPADAVLVGGASTLFLFTWNRAGVESLSLTGRRAVAEAWRTLPV